jgi:hypothetical protein
MTYTTAFLGRRADHLFPPTAITNVSTTVGVLDMKLTDANGLAGGVQLAARNGTQVLCQLPDGSQGYFVVDAERTTNPAQPVLRAVAP